MIYLTHKALQYLWASFGEYSFLNQDNLGLGFGRLKTQNIPESRHYTIDFWRVPTGKIKETWIELCFDGCGKYTGIRTASPKSRTKKDLQRWEAEAMEYLEKNGYLTRE